MLPGPSGKDAPCEFCTTHLLKEGENYTWEFTNPLTRRHYILKDRLIEWENKYLPEWKSHLIPLSLKRKARS